MHSAGMILTGLQVTYADDSNEEYCTGCSHNAEILITAPIKCAMVAHALVWNTSILHRSRT